MTADCLTQRRCRGSVRLVVNAATGAVVQRIDYGPWGEPVLVSGSWDVQPFGFAGGLYDADTGLVHFGARDYDPRSGRRTAKDPILFAGGDVNLYAYVGGDPVNGVDPEGMRTTVLVTYDSGYGSHAAVLVERGADGDPVLYDPAGGYQARTRGTGDYVLSCRLGHSSYDSLYNDYVAYHTESGSRVVAITFDTTPQQESEIFSRIEDRGGTMGGLCTSSTSAAIRGIGPFPSDSYLLPGRLADRLRRIPGAVVREHSRINN